MKRMKHIFLLAAVLCMVFCLTACGGSETPDTQQPDVTVSDTGLPQQTQDPIETTTLPLGDGKVTYTVTVVDTNGNPISGAMVQICKDTCIPTSTNEQGVATWSQPEDDYKVSFLMVPAGYTADAAEFYFEAGSYELTITLTPAE